MIFLLEAPGLYDFESSENDFIASIPDSRILVYTVKKLLFCTATTKMKKKNEQKRKR